MLPEPGCNLLEGIHVCCGIGENQDDGTLLGFVVDVGIAQSRPIMGPPAAGSLAGAHIQYGIVFLLKLQVLLEERIGVLVNIGLGRLLRFADRLLQLLTSHLTENIALFVKVFLEFLIRAKMLIFWASEFKQ